MKIIILSFVVLVNFSVKAQTFENFRPINSLSSYFEQGSEVTTVDIRINTSNNVYLFSNWENYARVYSSKGQVLAVNNINFDIKNSRFETQVSKDSIFVFTDIYKVNVNNRSFSRVNNKFYEVLHSSAKNFVFMKEFFLKFEPETHQITNTVISSGNYKTDCIFYILKDGEVKRITLNKKDILDLLETKKGLILNFVNDYNLSFKKEEDVLSILQFYDRK